MSDEPVAVEPMLEAAPAIAPAGGSGGRSTFHVGDPMPAVLTFTQFAEILGVSHAMMHNYYAGGFLAPFELQPKIGKRVRFSGKRVQAWLDKTPADPLVGDEAPSRSEFFGAAERRARLAKIARRP